MITFHLHLKKTVRQKYTSLQFDLEKLKDPKVAETFLAMISGIFASLNIRANSDTDMDEMITTINTTITETASEILGKHCPMKKPWVTTEALDLCGMRIESKRVDGEGARKYRKLTMQSRKA